MEPGGIVSNPVSAVPVALQLSATLLTSEEVIKTICQGVQQYKLTSGPRVKTFILNSKGRFLHDDTVAVSQQLYDPDGELRHLGAQLTYFAHFNHRNGQGNQFTLTIDTCAPANVITIPAPVE